MKLSIPYTYTFRSTALFFALVFVLSSSAHIPCGLALSLAGSASSCAGHDTLRLSGASTASQIVWQSGSNSVTVDSSGGTIDTIFIPIIGGNYEAIVTDPGGCLDTSRLVTVDSTFTPSVSISTGYSHSICAGTKITFTPHPTNGGSPGYQWYVSGVPVSTSAVFVDSTLRNNDSVWVVMTSSLTCLTVDTAISNIIPYVVDTFVTPTVSISINTGDTICQNEQVTFFAVGINGGGNPDYQWIANGVNVGNSPTYIGTTILSGDVYSCVITSTALCVTQAQASSDSITFTVIPYPAVSVCTGDSLRLTASGGISYIWSNNDSTQSIYATRGTTYTVTATNNYGCTAAAVDVVPADAQFSDSVSLSNDTIALISTGPGEFYQWYINGSIINDAVGTSYIATQSGTYQVSVIDSFGCLTSSAVIYFAEAGINTITPGPSINLYPNPNSGIFTLECTDATPRLVTISDQLGRVIIDNMTATGQQQFDLSSIAEGIYYLHVSDGINTSSLKFSVVK